MNESRLQLALAVLPVLSAGLYLMGVTYHQGYLDGFGIEDSLFPLSIDRSLLSGFLALVSFGLIPMAYTVFAAMALATSVVVAAALSSIPRVNRWQAIVLTKLHSMRSKNAPPPALNNLSDKWATVLMYVVGVFVVVFLLAVVAVLSTKSGREQARKEIDAFKSQNGNYVTLHTASLPATTRAKQIICSTSHCAYWLGSEAIVLRHENIERVLTHNPAVP